MAGPQSEPEIERDEREERGATGGATFRSNVHHFEVRPSSLGSGGEERRAVQAIVERSGQRVEGFGDDRPIERGRNHLRLFQTTRPVLVG